MPVSRQAAAGFQDHEIGPVIGTSGNTGAGGANVWNYENLMAALPEHFQPLPKQASMRVAIRRTPRVGKRAGDPLEDLGVVSDHFAGELVACRRVELGS